MEVKLTEKEAEALIRAVEIVLAGDGMFDIAPLNRAKTKLEMARSGEKVSSD